MLLGAVGGPRWESKPRPEEGLLALRKELGLYANLRPVAPHETLLDASTLKPEVVASVNLLVVRELTSGIYFGRRKREPRYAEDVCSYSAEEVERVVRVAGRLARGRRKRLASVDKANVLDTSRLWREVTSRVVRDEFPDVALEHLLVVIHGVGDIHREHQLGINNARTCVFRGAHPHPGQAKTCGPSGKCHSCDRAAGRHAYERRH